MTRLFGHSLPSRITKWNNIEQLAGGNMVEIYDLGLAITIWPFLRLLSLFLKTLRVIGSLFLSLFPGYAQVGTRLIWPLKRENGGKRHGKVFDSVATQEIFSSQLISTEVMLKICTAELADAQRKAEISIRFRQDAAN